MREKKTLLQRARIDIELAKENIVKLDDELYLDVSAYHIHQAIEKLLKFQIEHAGESYRKTHDLGLLWEEAEQIELSPPEWIWANRIQLNRYQSETRYGDDIVASRRELKEIVELAEAYYKKIEASIIVSESPFSAEKLL